MQTYDSQEDLLSKTIDFVRFPLIVGVVMIHSGLEDLVDISQYPVFANISFLVSRVIALIAVPLFFFISGFLFFYKTNTFTKKLYLTKIKRRIHTLLIPYIFWNIVIVIGYFIIQTLLPNLMFGEIKFVSDYSFRDWIAIFWDSANGNVPINTALWFIRDLMVVCCLSPLVYWLIKKLDILIIIILGVLYVTDIWIDIPGLSIACVFFFSAGAYFSITKKNFIQLLTPDKYKSYLLTYIIIALTCLYINDIHIDGQKWGGVLNRLTGIAAVISTSAYFIRKGKWAPNSFLTSSAFFIYSYHLTLAFIRKYIVNLLQPHSEIALLGIYLLWPTFIICLGLVLYYLMRRFVPKFTAVITGGR